MRSATAISTPSTGTRPKAAAAGAWVALGSFVGLAITIGARNGVAPPEVPDTLAKTGAALGAAMHLALVPVVAALPAPRWARRAGYAWLAIDTVTNLMTLGGGRDATTTAIRLVGHLPAAAWVALAASAMPTGSRRIGLVLAAWLAGYTIAAPVVPDAAFMPAVALMVAWLTLVARQLSRS